MITVEDLLMAYASAYDAWLDPEAERKNPTPEYAELIRQAVSFENAKLRELMAGVGHLLFALDVDYCATCPRDGINHPCPVHTTDGGECLYKTDMRELGIEANG